MFPPAILAPFAGRTPSLRHPRSGAARMPAQPNQPDSPAVQSVPTTPVPQVAVAPVGTELRLESSGSGHHHLVTQRWHGQGRVGEAVGHSAGSRSSRQPLDDFLVKLTVVVVEEHL